MIRITWLKPEERVLHEFKQLREEGADPASLEAAWEDAVRTRPQSEQRSAALALLTELRALRLDDADPRAFLESLPNTEPAQFAEDDLYDRLLGGWTGRMAGCLLGKPVEKIPREGIRAILESINEWPLKRYFTAEGVPPDVTGRFPWNRASRPHQLARKHSLYARRRRHQLRDAQSGGARDLRCYLYHRRYRYHLAPADARLDCLYCRARGLRKFARALRAPPKLRGTTTLTASGSARKSGQTCGVG